MRRSFRSKLLYACAWAAPVFSVALPSQDHREVTRPQGKLLQLDFQQNYAQATFNVPCTGCGHTGQDDESLTLSFTSHALDVPCGSSNITLNGLHLPQEWNGDFASGYGSYPGVTNLQQNAWFLQHDLDLEWESACLHGYEDLDEAAQVVTVNIKAIDGKPTTTPSGFTISFKQHTSPPSLLRLEPVPNPSASNREVAESWREPPQSLRLSLPNTITEVNEVELQSLENQIRELKALEAELAQLQALVTEKKRLLNSQLRKQVKTFTEELNQCDNFTCIVKTIAHEAHGAWRVAYIHFQTGNRHSPGMGRPEEVFAHAHDHATQMSGGRLQVEPATPIQASTVAFPSSNPAETRAPNVRFGCSGDGSSCPAVAPEELPPRPPRPSPCLLALEITLGLLCCGCLMAIIRHKCASLRTRTERAAAREERLNAQAYRRAARQHVWRNWWRGNWASRRKDSERIVDYEEKRALIQEQEGVLEEAMQDEIRQLRVAHEIVNDLVRDAEEGRIVNHAPCHCHRQPPRAPYSPLSTASTYPPTSLPEIPSRPLSRTDSLPSYRSGAPTEPPNYDSEVDMSDIVANGFRQYTTATRSTTSEVSSHWTPDSSIVDVSPRPSADTLRYPQSLRSLRTGDEDGSDESDAD
ncbi:hypothetical protein IAQ61_000579 [Plenodomus lingam]|uniref:Uncharacterized protein n=1 Tax=Leptosphaeria maculans (strain JN3 / isolate v23.1.3 / race Av1-4-5-6-7-8) TaxID=985895 RepID=E5A6P1_LEPMJ|nr:hypothetical protein LEMA_P085250.1 [Plenodomus lingam JN3]KAH9880290.1 hypothetical protein IAQ61_000579 [Plenodomus lingam]CBX99286.1 hypothetical protein LEMA_P085250.1 [Plenodomus lingam JN3]